MSDSENLASLLEELVEEIRGLRSDFAEFTGMMNLGDAVGVITGPGGYNMQDINERLYEVAAAVSSVETAIDLK